LGRTLILGKADRGFLHRVVYRKLGAHRPEILVGPEFGVDNAVVKVGGGKVLVATTDPLSFIPALGPQNSAWLSVNLLASDLTTSGFAPQYGIFDLNLPPEMNDTAFAHYWKAFHKECKQLGVSVVGGHTGRYEGCGYTIIGGGVLYALGSEDRYLSSAMAESGDDIILTKGAAVETTAVLTRAFPRTVRRALGARLYERAWGWLTKVTTVKDALTAASVGVHRQGVTAMHDATEGGVIGAILEFADASGLGAELDLDDISVEEETREVCKFFQIDPLVSLSEGSLIIACRPGMTGRVLNRLSSERIESTVIGSLNSKAGFVYGTSRKGRFRMRYPKADPYWKAYRKATMKHWN